MCFLSSQQVLNDLLRSPTAVNCDVRLIISIVQFFMTQLNTSQNCMFTCSSLQTRLLFLRAPPETFSQSQVTSRSKLTPHLFSRFLFRRRVLRGVRTFLCALFTQRAREPLHQGVEIRQISHIFTLFSFLQLFQSRCQPCR